MSWVDGQFPRYLTSGCQAGKPILARVRGKCLIMPHASLPPSSKLPQAPVEVVVVAFPWCKDFGERFDLHSPPVLFLLIKWRSACIHQFHFFRPG